MTTKPSESSRTPDEAIAEVERRLWVMQRSILARPTDADSTRPCLAWSMNSE